MSVSPDAGLLLDSFGGSFGGGPHLWLRAMYAYSVRSLKSMSCIEDGFSGFKERSLVGLCNFQGLRFL